MNKKHISFLAGTYLLFLATGFSAAAAVPETTASKAYDSAVDIRQSLDGIDVSVVEYTVVPDVKENAEKKISLKASGLKDLEHLTVSISIETSEGTKEQFYKGGYFFDDQSGEKIKYAAKPEEMLEIINYYVYTDLDSSKLAALDEEDGTYYFTATEESLGTYIDKILEGVQSEHQMKLVTLQGTVKTDENNQITRQRLQTVYTIKSGDTPQTVTSNTITTYHNPGQKVTVELPDLSEYKVQNKKESLVEITEKYQTVYATADVNVRAQNNVTATVLGGISAGGSMEQTGFTSDGWIQIDYNGTRAYVCADYVSEIKPIIVKSMSGTMYATTDVFVRDKAGSEGTILGSLALGEGVEVTGYTNNNWIRVKYLGHLGYVCQSYLTWDQPVTAMGGNMYVISEFANIREYYSTDSEICGTLSYGDEVVVTGYSSNNWIRVRYNGITGFIYGDLLSWTSPYQESIFENTIYLPDENSESDAEPSVKQAYGVLVSFGTSTITVACNNGRTIHLIKDDLCVMNAPDGIYVGQSVSIVYSYDEGSGMYLLQSLDAF